MRAGSFYAQLSRDFSSSFIYLGRSVLSVGRNALATGVVIVRRPSVLTCRVIERHFAEQRPLGDGAAAKRVFGFRV